MTTDPIKVGDVYARVSHGRIVNIDGDSIEVENESGFRWTIGRIIVEREFAFAGKFTRSEKVSHTKLEEIFRHGVGSNVFQVKFTKKPDISDGVSAITAADWGSADERKRRRVVSDILKGEERTLIGRLNINAYRSSSHETETLGRMKVVDLMAPAGTHNERLVDMRTVSELIVDNVRYHV